MESLAYEVKQMHRSKQSGKRYMYVYVHILYIHVYCVIWRDIHVYHQKNCRGDKSGTIQFQGAKTSHHSMLCFSRGVDIFHPLKETCIH